MIKRLIQWIHNFLKKHWRGAIIGAAGIGAGGAAAGFVNNQQAKKINNRARAIQKEALQLHKEEYQATQTVLSELGEIKLKAANSFPRFANAMERIQGRPQFKDSIITSVKLPSYEPHELKKISEDVQMMIAGAGGAGAAALVGLAAFGVAPLIVAPAVAGGGIVLCVKGIGLKKKAVKNERQANAIKKDVDEIVAFYADVRKTASSFCDSISAVYDRFEANLQRMEILVDSKDKWKEYTRQEKRVVENTTLLVRLLFSMIETNVVVKSKNENKIEVVNTGAITKLQKQAGRLLNEAS